MSEQIAAAAGVTGTPAQFEAAEVSHARYRSPPLEKLRPPLHGPRPLMTPGLFLLLANSLLELLTRI